MLTNTSNTLENRVAVVTGAARGIGRDIAFELGRRGAKVAIADSSKDAERVAEDFQGMGICSDFFFVDLVDPGSISSLVSAVSKRFGSLDILVNNARARGRFDWNDEPTENWDLAFDVNVRAANLLTREASTLMIKGGGGAVVNVGSIAAKFVTNESPAYHVSKAALSHLTRYLAWRLGKFKIRVNSVLPGFVVQEEHLERFMSTENENFRNSAILCHPLGRVGASRDVSYAAAFLCSDESSFITGQEIVVDGGLTLADSWAVMSKNLS